MATFTPSQDNKLLQDRQALVTSLSQLDRQRAEVVNRIQELENHLRQLDQVRDAHIDRIREIDRTRQNFTGTQFDGIMNIFSSSPRAAPSVSREQIQEELQRRALEQRRENRRRQAQEEQRERVLAQQIESGAEIPTRPRGRTVLG